MANQNKATFEVRFVGGCQFGIDHLVEIAWDLAHAMAMMVGALSHAETRTTSVSQQETTDSRGIERIEIVATFSEWFEEERGVIADALERWRQRVADELQVNIEKVELITSWGAEGIPAPPGPCLDGGGSLEDIVGRAMAKPDPPDFEEERAQLRC